ncbi:MAG: HAD family phosphatase [Terracidiphilus sp.]
MFDFDGVVADTEPLHWRSWAALLAPQGISLTWEDYCKLGRGIKDEQMLESLSELASNPTLRSILNQQIGQRKEMIRRWCLLQSPISSSTVRLLKSLKAFRLGLVTSSNRNEVEPLLRAAGIYQCFDASVYADEVYCNKPNPEPYLLIRERLGIETGLAFEDSLAGLESASLAGFIAIRVDRPENLPLIVRKSLDDDLATDSV